MLKDLLPGQWIKVQFLEVYTDKPLKPEWVIVSSGVIYSDRGIDELKITRPGILNKNFEFCYMNESMILEVGEIAKR